MVMHKSENKAARAWPSHRRSQHAQIIW